MTNRVDELEGQLAELRAAVNGLTEELVETKARVRELEAEAEPDELDTDSEANDVDTETETRSTGTRTQNDDHVMVVEHDRDGIGHATETVDGEEAGESTTSEDTTDEEPELETDDIIVA